MGPGGGVRARSPLDVVRETARELAAARVPSPRNDAEILVAAVLGVSRAELYAVDGGLGEDELQTLRSLVERRRRREPLAYVLGEWGFRGLTLAVDRRALVPRPETEIVVERCLALLRDLGEPRVLDVGVGSGAIALSLAVENPCTRVWATDASTDALALARENVRRTGVGERVALVSGEVFAGLAGPFDLVVSNPPYVREEEVGALEPEVADWEPRCALVAPGVTSEVARGARDVLRAGGWLVLESGAGQARVLAEELDSLGYEHVAVTPDLAGIERVVEGRRP